MARKVKILVREKGILSTPDPKAGQSFIGFNYPVNSVTEFYNYDEVSRQKTGKKDFVSVNKSSKISRYLHSYTCKDV